MRNRFDRELDALNNELIEMGSMIEEAIGYANEALVSKDVPLAQKAIDYDQEIDEKERVIERHCLRLLLQQQPVATDLRANFHGFEDDYRHGAHCDHAADISEITIRLAPQEYIKKLEHLPKMQQATTHMVNQSIDAYVKRDLDLAHDVIAYDDVVDDLFNEIKEELIHLIRQNAENGEQCIDFLMIAKYFERIGDHAVNIAEWVIFSITGQHKDQRIM